MPAGTATPPVPPASQQAPCEGQGAGVLRGCASSTAPQERAPAGQEKPANTMCRQWLGHAWPPHKWATGAMWERGHRDVQRCWANPGGAGMGSRVPRRWVSGHLEQRLNG